MVWRVLSRLILVPLGVLLAGIAALLVLLSLGLERATQVAAGRNWDLFDLSGAGFDLLTQGQLMASAVTIIPALLLVIIGEVAKIRSSIYYVFGGGLALAAIPLVAKIGYAGATFGPTDAVWQVFATAGFAGGLVYWLVAGRRA